jgi:erythromycin esterase-like protein
MAMTQHVRPGGGLAGPQLTRRAFLGLSAGVVGGLAVPASPALAAGTGGSVVPWIDRHAVPMSGTDPQQPAGELSHLRGVVRGAAIVGLGESAHGTHTQLRLKHRVARYLVENLGFRTIAWEEGWGSGVAIDRYVTSGRGDPTAIVGDALFMLRTEAMLELVGWMREFNRGRPDHDKSASSAPTCSSCARSSSTRSDDTSPRSRRTNTRSWRRTWRRSTGAATRSPSSAGTPS